MEKLNSMDDEKSPPMPGPEPGTPARMEQTLNTIPQSHSVGRVVIYHGDR